MLHLDLNPPSLGGSTPVQTYAGQGHAPNLHVLFCGLRPADVCACDSVRNVKETIMHVEGDPDHPVNRGTLCPKGASLLDFVHSPSRLKYPEYRAPGSSEWKRMSWDEALNRIAKLLKEDRDANFVETNDKGQKVNRWLTTGMLAASASSNEAGYITHKVARSWGLLAFDNQARV